MNRTTLICGTALAAFLSTAAVAQTSPAAESARQDSGTAQRTDPTGQDPAPSSDDGLRDIIVTATKVETVLQKTPQAITVIDGSALVEAGVATAQDLNKLVPGLQIEQNGSSSSIYIRGIGSRVVGPNQDPAVAFSVDGVYYSRASGTTTTLFDLDRVEVVKGPQGTLYGRNATGGAVNVVSRRPKLGVRSVDAEIEVGNYNAVRAVMGLNLPLGDNAALRVAGQSIYNSGFLSDGYNDTDIKAGRVSLLIEPTSALSIFVSADYSAQGGQGAGAIITGPSVNNSSIATRFVVPDDPFVGPSDPRSNAVLARALPAQAVAGPGPGTFCRAQVVGAPTPGGIPARLLCTYPFGVAPIARDGFLANEFYGGNLTINADLGFADVTAIGGYRRTEIDSLQRIDFGRQRVSGTADQYSAELRISSAATGEDRFRWLVGAFYLREQQDTLTIIDSNNQAIGGPGVFCATAPVAGFCVARPALIQQETRLDSPKLVDETYAGFGEATVSATDWLRFTAGLRFTREEKSEENGVITLVYASPPGLTRSYPSAGRVGFNDTSYRLGVEVDVAPQSMFYATHSTAFHVGGLNVGVEQGPNRYPFAAEKVRSYVVGIKNRFFDNRLQLNVEGFWNDYRNYQQSSLGYINDGSQTCSVLLIRTTCPLTLRIDNAAKARIRGVEADVLLRVGSNGTLSANILYNDTKFLQFDVVNAFTNAVVSYAGQTLPGVNKFTVSAGYTQRFPLISGGEIVGSARTIFRNAAYLWFERFESQFQPAYTRTDLTLGYHAPDNQWRLTGFVRNVEDEAALNQGGPLSAASGLRFSNLNPPRTYGLILGFNF
ncbi:TonB-dependent receptor [Sphingomonas sp.]|jgi:iron complex outermembrane receptor protein|uniref:TonB-dependent receptor n=1 Tax=Sphingomonas sp. TaxID=28214 RepID=UPI002D80AEDD|nr:TonB-dependent receptor [Sphingomonas sp.]HEU0044491.1 TonB-dependent receptor [Sphingomonas sp.]